LTYLVPGVEDVEEEREFSDVEEVVAIGRSVNTVIVVCCIVVVVSGGTSVVVGLEVMVGEGERLGAGSFPCTTVSCLPAPI
jgi:hypothetical protein